VAGECWLIPGIQAEKEIQKEYFRAEARLATRGAWRRGLPRAARGGEGKRRIMKRILMALAMLLPGVCAIAQDIAPVLRWSVVVTNYQGHDLQLRRGETVWLEPTFLWATNATATNVGFNLAQATDVILRYRAPVAGAPYYAVTGSVYDAENGIVRVRWTPAAETKHDLNSYEIAVLSSSSVLVRCFGQMMLNQSVSGGSQATNNPDPWIWTFAGDVTGRWNNLQIVLQTVGWPELSTAVSNALSAASGGTNTWATITDVNNTATLVRAYADAVNNASGVTDRAYTDLKVNETGALIRAQIPAVGTIAPSNNTDYVHTSRLVGTNNLSQYFGDDSQFGPSAVKLLTQYMRVKASLTGNSGIRWVDDAYTIDGHLIFDSDGFKFYNLKPLDGLFYVETNRVRCIKPLEVGGTNVIAAIGGNAAANLATSNRLTAVTWEPYTIPFAASNMINIALGSWQYYAPTDTTTIYLPDIPTNLGASLRLDIQKGAVSVTMATQNADMGGAYLTNAGIATLILDKAAYADRWRAYTRGVP